MIIEKHLDLDESVNVWFQMKLVHQLLRYKIKSERISECWINYCGMSVYFNMNEFVIITDLNCHLPNHYVAQSTKVDRRYQQIVDAMKKSIAKENSYLSFWSLRWFEEV